MLRLMASGEPVELTSPMASVKKLARLAFIAQQFGYEYADVRQSSGRNGALTMLVLPDPSPQARARAGQNWAQYPNASDGVSLPPLVPDAFELLKARINFDLTGKNAEKRMGYAALGVTVGCVVLALRSGGESSDFVAAGVVWLLVMAVFGIGLLVTRRRNAKFAARLQAAGFTPVREESGRLRYLPPGAQPPGQGNPFGGGPYAGGPYGGAPGAGVPGHAGAPPQAPGMQPGQVPGVPAAPRGSRPAGTRPVRPAGAGGVSLPAGTGAVSRPARARPVRNAPRARPVRSPARRRAVRSPARPRAVPASAAARSLRPAAAPPPAVPAAESTLAAPARLTRTAPDLSSRPSPG
ncbi:integral membrane protein [Streptomyces viridochromogenes DSM 40736]|uniref:Integral membrane protein n=1 Tax=Streptomyces viridochromogenes (strain DSM 40736 / JCM 4977 / BCRC 1201 / Tue 494) TaxID=591159 RepID=D9XDT7_STRVT|nr:integral membrane protein [Streptomyces viridochromogenes DSM 40736]